MKKIILLLIAITTFTAANCNADDVQAVVPKTTDVANVVVSSFNNGSQNPESVVQGIWTAWLIERIFSQQAKPLIASTMETSRTDKQIGAGPSSVGTTSLAVKPALSELLSIAIEQGAISQKNNGASTTLSTTPYAIISKLGTNDNSETARKYWLWRHIGLFATFPISSNSNFDTRTISEWGIRLLIGQDRTPRTNEFWNTWQSEIKPVLQNSMNALAKTEKKIFDNINTPTYAELDASRKNVTKKIQEYLANCKTNNKIPIPGEIDDIINKELAAGCDRVRPIIPKDIINAANNDFAEYIRSNDELLIAMNKINETPIATLEYINQHNDNSINTQQLRLSYNQYFDFLGPFDLNVNGQVSFYNDSNKAGKSTNLKDYGGTVALDAKFINFYQSSNPKELSYITVTGSGAVNKVEGTSGVRGNAQLKIEIPLSMGLSIPIAYTYSSRTDTSDKEENRFNIGLSIDMDKVKAAFGNL